MNVKNDSKDLKNYQKSAAELGTPSTLTSVDQLGTERQRAKTQSPSLETVGLTT